MSILEGILLLFMTILLIETWIVNKKISNIMHYIDYLQSKKRLPQPQQNPVIPGKIYHYELKTNLLGY